MIFGVEYNRIGSETIHKCHSISSVWMGMAKLLCYKVLPFDKNEDAVIRKAVMVLANGVELFLLSGLCLVKCCPYWVWRCTDEVEERGIDGGNGDGNVKRDLVGDIVVGDGGE